MKDSEEETSKRTTAKNRSDGPLYGQVIIGPPGSGKSTYCHGVQQFMASCEESTQSVTKRTLVLVNLDPANDSLPYEAAIDVCKFISVENIMETFSLGPNGALVYAMQYLDEQFEWLQTQIQDIQKTQSNCYFIFDLPGQVELYTHEECLKSLLGKLQAEFDFRFTVVHLVDSHYCSDSYKFVSVLLLSLSAMMRLELPHVNVLSKIDLIEKYGSLPFNLDFYTDVLDLSYLLESIENEERLEGGSDLSDDEMKKKRKPKFHKMNTVLTEIIEDYSLVKFLPLNIQDGKNLLQLLGVIDKCNGCAFSVSLEADLNLVNVASTLGVETALDDIVKELQEKVLDSKS